MIRRSCGVLMHISSLNGNLGIGTFGENAYRFVDFLKANGQTYWQILPLNIIDDTNSPYLSPSAFAGNPLFIDLDLLRKEGYLNFSDYMAVDWGNAARVDYKNLKIKRKNVFLTLYERFLQNTPKDYENFCNENAHWLEPFCAYMQKIDGKPYHKMLQYFFFKQWFNLKDYANKNGIKIIGDIPFYVSGESVDCLENPDIFELSEVSGCPPDEFSKKGQLWGSPTYNWERLKATDYKWWIDRLAFCKKLYDVIRIDHFRALDSYYCIKKGEKTAENGVWRKGPKMDFINSIKRQIPNLELIAEDLGFITDSLRELIIKSGYPGMKVLQFGFDSREGGDYLPHNCPKNSVVYTGTHDNNTILGWESELTEPEREYAKRYLRSNDLAEGLMLSALSSHSDICILTMQDILRLGNSARMNTPSTLKNNWEWRMTDGQLLGINNFLADNTKLYGRWNNETA